MKLGIRGHDFGKRGEFSLPERLSQGGFDGVQLVPYKTYADVDYSVNLSPQRAAEISKSLEDKGLSILLLGAYFNPVHSNKEKVRLGIDVFDRYLQLEGEFKTSVVASETGSFNDDKWTYNPLNRTFSALETVIETFSRLASNAKKYGAGMAMEGAAGHVCYSPERLNEALAAIGDDSIKVVFDLYNYLDGDNYADYKNILQRGLKLFEGRIHCFHMKDCTFDGGKVTQCPIGEGNLDYSYLLREIKAYDEDAVLVLEGTTGDNIPKATKIITELW